MACSPFDDDNTTRSTQRTAHGRDVIVAITKTGNTLKILDADSCNVLHQTNIRRRDRGEAHKLRVRNLYKLGGPAGGAPEIMVTSRINKRRMNVATWRISPSHRLRAHARNTVRVTRGRKRVRVRNRWIGIGGANYRAVKVNGDWTIHKRKNGMTFLALGDTGENGADKEAVAAAMNDLAGNTNAVAWMVFLGDIFYPPDRVTSVDDEDFEGSMVTPYDLDFLDMPQLIALGNHEYDDNDVESILAWDADPTDRWYLPSRYYRVQYPSGSSAPLVELFVLDTEMIDDRDPGYQDQLDWLDAKLNSSQATWKIVAGHHPVYSYGQHGDTATMISDVLPILQEHAVPLYMAGHDHDLQLIDHPDDDALYVVSGAGSRLRAVEEGENSRFAQSTYGYARVDFSRQDLRVRFYTTNNEKLFSITRQAP